MNPLGYYTGYNPQTQKPDTLHLLQERFGSQLELMTYEQKIVMRAALADYIASSPMLPLSGNSGDLIDACIKSVGTNWNISNQDRELCEWITDCSKLTESDIEGLIDALTSQIRGKVYASRSTLFGGTYEP
jgi:hypothetical protein